MVMSDGYATSIGIAVVHERMVSSYWYGNMSNVTVILPVALQACTNTIPSASTNAACTAACVLYVRKWHLTAHEFESFKRGFRMQSIDH